MSDPTVVAIFLLLLVASIIGDQHLNANGPFGKQHSMAKIPSPTGCNRTIGASWPAVASFTLNVTATVYSSNEQINVTWTALSNPCVDDFIGIYFIDIPLSTGTYTGNISKIVIVMMLLS